MHIRASLKKKIKSAAVKRNVLSTFLLKRMLRFSHNMVFIKNEAALLCVTMLEHARAFVATI